MSADKDCDDLSDVAVRDVSARGGNARVHSRGGGLLLGLAVDGGFCVDVGAAAALPFVGVLRLKVLPLL